MDKKYLISVLAAQFDSLDEYDMPAPSSKLAHAAMEFFEKFELLRSDIIDLEEAPRLNEIVWHEGFPPSSQG